MKQYIHLLPVLLMTLLLATACQSARESTKNDTQNAAQKESIDTIWNTWDEVLKESYNNIYFEKDLQCEKPQEVAVYQMEQFGNVDEKAEQIRKEYVPDKETIKNIIRKIQIRFRPDRSTWMKRPG